MTVAAVLLFASTESAVRDAAGRPGCRRMVEAAWAGGATPIVVVATDVDGQVAQALAGSPAVLAEPAPPEGGAVAQIARGIAVALDHVTETDAALIWPGRLTWVDAETVTTLIEHHGLRRQRLLRPEYGGAVGWPALLPTVHVPALAGLARELGPDELMALLGEHVGVELVATGDPGVVYDRDTPIDALPPYAGPPEPVGRAPEWGGSVADTRDDLPLAGPALAPYGQAADPEAD